MAYPSILFGPEREVFNDYAAVSPAPGDNGSGGAIAQRGRHALGKQLVLEDGRKYRFSRVGGTALVRGNVLTSAAIITTDQSMALAVGAVDDRILTFTHGAATVVINYFAEGFGVISLAPGSGLAYKIASHAALQSAVAGDIVNLAPGVRVRVALTTTSDLSLLANTYDGLIQAAATTLTGAPVGIAHTVTAANRFCWVQTRGLASVLTAGVLVVGANAISPTGVAGAAGPSGAATSAHVGIVQMVEADTEWSGVFLTLDG